MNTFKLASTLPCNVSMYVRKTTNLRGIFSSGRADAGAQRALNDPVECRGNRDADAGGQRIDNEIFQPGVPAGHPELQQFEHAS